MRPSESVSYESLPPLELRAHAHAHARTHTHIKLSHESLPPLALHTHARARTHTHTHQALIGVLAAAGGNRYVSPVNNSDRLSDSFHWSKQW